AVALADRLAAVRGVEVLNETFFNEFTIKIPGDAARTVERMAEKGVLGGVPVSRLLPDKGLDDLILAASTEVNTEADRAAFVEALQGALSC
ncbi:MAG: glycine dehydrogenase, partial [Pseudomonadota bacterium]|nr:glycine dehydrogenase [Pseudomonadota bacterium]